MKKLKNTKGITLIALIITIIVLLILAIVSIRIILNGGIIRRANDGTQAYSVAQEKEQIQLGYKEYQMAKFEEATPTLKVEGASNVTGDETNGWTITFASGRTYNLAADGTITGGEVASENESQNARTVEDLAKSGEIQRWDKINYDPGTATSDSITLPSGTTVDGFPNVGFPNDDDDCLPMKASDATDWVVLDVNQTTGEVLIIPTETSKVQLILEGKEGYNNSIEALNAVASICKNSKYAISSRSISLEDLNKLTNTQIPNNFTPVERTFNHRYGVDNNLNIVDAGEGNSMSRTFTSNAPCENYSYYRFVSFFF